MNGLFQLKEHFWSSDILFIKLNDHDQDYYLNLIMNLHVGSHSLSSWNLQIMNSFYEYSNDELSSLRTNSLHSCVHGTGLEMGSLILHDELSLRTSSLMSSKISVNMNSAP
jgi:hypothetical protein